MFLAYGIPHLLYAIISFIMKHTVLLRYIALGTAMVLRHSWQHAISTQHYYAEIIIQESYIQKLMFGTLFFQAGEWPIYPSNYRVATVPPKRRWNDMFNNPNKIVYQGSNSPKIIKKKCCSSFPKRLGLAIVTPRKRWTCTCLRGGTKGRWGQISTSFCAHPVSIPNFPLPLGASQFPASISFHT